MHLNPEEIKTPFKCLVKHDWNFQSICVLHAGNFSEKQSFVTLSKRVAKHE